MTQGVTLIFSYICRPGSFFGFKILNLNIFFYMKICGYFFFLFLHKIGLKLGVISIFLRSRYRMGDIFGVAKISNIFWGCLKFLIFFGVNGRCWARA